MNPHNIVYKVISAILISTIVLVSCKEEIVETRIRESYADKTVTLITSPSALHGRGYSSIYTEALMKQADQYGFRLRILTPKTLEEGHELVQSSFSDLKYSDTLQELTPEETAAKLNNNFFILGDALYSLSAYERLIETGITNLENHVLLFETANTSLPFYTFCIEKYAPMYIAGHIASNFSNRIALITAYKGNKELDSSIQGFQDGCDACGYVKDFKVFYLSDNSDGFNKVVPAERLADSLFREGYEFIMPLAGQSNDGIYNASLHSLFGYTAGMDCNADAKSDKVTFNIEVHIDSIVCKYTNAFLKDSLSSLSRHTRYNIETGEVDIESSNKYMESIHEWIVDLKKEAIEKEKKYLNVPVEIKK